MANSKRTMAASTSSAESTPATSPAGSFASLQQQQQQGRGAETDALAVPTVTMLRGLSGGDLVAINETDTVEWSPIPLVKTQPAAGAAPDDLDVARAARAMRNSKPKSTSSVRMIVEIGAKTPSAWNPFANKVKPRVVRQRVMITCTPLGDERFRIDETATIVSNDAMRAQAWGVFGIGPEALVEGGVVTRCEIQGEAHFDVRSIEGEHFIAPSRIITGLKSGVGKLRVRSVAGVPPS